jgi:plasmid stabilization system protein ParE
MARKRCIFSPRAHQDFDDILNYIGRSDPENAVAFVDRLQSICASPFRQQRATTSSAVGAPLRDDRRSQRWP